MRVGVRRSSVVLVPMVALLVGSSSAWAQQTQAPQAQAQQTQNQPNNEGFGVVIVGGPLFATLTDTTGFNTERKTGYLVGLALGGNRTGVVGVEADVLYGKRGAKVNGQDLDLQVVHVPVMLKVNIGDTSRASGFMGFGVVGPSFDWLFDSKLGNVDISDDTEGYEVGLVFGGGVEVLRFSAQLRYMRGLRSINKNFELGVAESIKSESFTILFGLRIN